MVSQMVFVLRPPRGEARDRIQVTTPVLLRAYCVILGKLFFLL